ncbi:MULTISPECIES: aa3-type cytochrome oxidase subunit IV [unclassified Streptomyces]|uniref:aa3-type cytochrome oxidase subunit IV n=1 Tax=unclassified Streptomyces TaxID=2593676 RepID=UPI0022B661AB|nr:MULTISPECIES: cytochrome c oxidase subunit 4 [unclassified Streptomyces]MCZ7413238.1 cytochrome c oxidase subunit 4 [Streptomyces sp. WMMC897]MCZ7430232.1 cytochrome c oxidase subunit 4 [Streptomyces sp. WMMC1477]
MKAEALYFTGVTGFFAAVSVPYLAYGDDPAGGAVLVVCALMAALVALFLWVQYLRLGRRPEDRGDGEIAERAGPLDFFPAHSTAPVVTAVGLALLGLGVVFGLWLFLIGLAVLAGGVFGFVFQYARGG